jgi:hypothetical protein
LSLLSTTSHSASSPLALPNAAPARCGARLRSPPRVSPHKASGARCKGMPLLARGQRASPLTVRRVEAPSSRRQSARPSHLFDTLTGRQTRKLSTRGRWPRSTRSRRAACQMEGHLRGRGRRRSEHSLTRLRVRAAVPAHERGASARLPSCSSAEKSAGGARLSSTQSLLRAPPDSPTDRLVHGGLR